MNLDPCHVLSGPFAIEGVEPGDILVVDIVNIGPFEEQPWGYTGIFAKENGGGFLTDYSPGASKAIWDLDGIWTSSRHVPGARFIGNSHPGLFGCAPSADLLAEWNRREQALIDQNPDRVTGDIPAHGGDVPGAPQVPALALPPQPKDALLGHAERGRPQAGRRGGVPHHPAARARRQRRHQGPRGGQPGLHAGVRARRQVLDRRPALRAGRR